MALTFYERATSRGFNKGINSADTPLKWFAGQSYDQVEVYAALVLLAPLLFDGLPRQSLRADPIGGGYWDCEVKYGFSAETKTDTPDAPEAPDDTTPLGPEMAFDITAETAHITQSLKTVLTVDDTTTDPWTTGTVYVVGEYAHLGGNVYVCTGTGTSGSTGPSGTGTGITDGSVTWDFYKPFQIGAPNYGRAIGVTRDRVEGTDVFTGHMEFTVKVQYYPILLPYLRTLLGMVGVVNNATWYQFPKGTLLYLGATGECKPGQVWTLTHKFAAAPNLTNIPVGNMIVAMKAGWDFLWTVYRDVSANGYLIQVPAFAYVEQVYRYDDYRKLGLGGP